MDKNKLRKNKKLRMGSSKWFRAAKSDPMESEKTTLPKKPAFPVGYRAIKEVLINSFVGLLDWVWWSDASLRHSLRHRLAT
jgi:hypothetical protein